MSFISTPGSGSPTYPEATIAGCSCRAIHQGFGQAVAFDDPLAAQTFDARKDCSIRRNMRNPIFLLVNRLHGTGERPGPTSVR
jgi:hypothetical protein